MQRVSLPVLTLLASTALSAPAFAAEVAAAQAQPANPAEDEVQAAASPGEIVVLASRIKGQVDAPEAPIATLDENDIASLGASSVAQLLERISPQTGSGRGRGNGPPVVLVNGQRITNFREMRNYPPEAIRRVEVLPEEVALRFGFPPDARVVNLILKDNFQNRRAELGYGLPSHGGFAVSGLEATLLRIHGPQRLNLNATIDHTTPLYESERGVAQAAASVPDVATDPRPADYRSLIAQSTNYGVTASWSKGLGKDGLGGSLSLSGGASRSLANSFTGLDVVRLTAPDGSSLLRALDDPLARRVATTTVQGGAGLTTFLGTWQFSGTLDATHSESTTRIDRRADTTALVAAAAAGTLPIGGVLPVLASAGTDTASSNSDGVTGLVTLTGRPLRLPAGDATVTLRSGYAWSNIESRDTRAGSSPANLTRGDLSAGMNLALPLTSKRENVLGSIGDLALNLSAGWDHLSDFGDLADWSAGLNWAPTKPLSLGVSYIVNEAAPTLAQLGSPTVQTFNVPVYDPSRGETALVTLTTGGNRQLTSERQRDWKFSLNWQLPIPGRSNLVVEYFRNHSSNVSASFPVLTSAIEAAFPGRVTRDSAGRLIAIDQRPVTFAEQTGSRLRWGLNLDGAVGAANGGGMGAPGGRGGRGGMMAMMGGPGGGGQGRWNIGVFHTVQFDSTVAITPGGPVLDLLGGDALSAGGTPRHSLEFTGGMFYKGFGFFSQGTWSAPTRLKASGQVGSSDLRFGAVTKLNVNFFADLGRMPKLVERAPLFKDTRLSLKFENLFDSRQKVTDANGAVPLSYQADYLVPRGRVITLEVRKAF